MPAHDSTSPRLVSIIASPVSPSDTPPQPVPHGSDALARYLSPDVPGSGSGSRSTLRAFALPRPPPSEPSIPPRHRELARPRERDAAATATVNDAVAGGDSGSILGLGLGIELNASSPRPIPGRSQVARGLPDRVGSRWGGGGGARSTEGIGGRIWALGSVRVGSPEDDRGSEGPLAERPSLSLEERPASGTTTTMSASASAMKGKEKDKGEQGEVPVETPRQKRDNSEAFARALVFDYLSQAGFVDTARILSRGRALLDGSTRTQSAPATRPKSEPDDSGDVMMESVADLGRGGAGMDVDVKIEDGEAAAEESHGYLSEAEVRVMQRRKDICAHILSGEITDALLGISQHFPDLLRPRPAAASGSAGTSEDVGPDSPRSENGSLPPSPSSADMGGMRALPAHMSAGTGAGGVGMARKGSAGSLASGATAAPPPVPIPPFPYAEVYDRPDFLKINLEIQQFVENLRHLVISNSPSSSMASSMHSEAPGSGGGAGGSKLQATAVTNAMISSNGSVGGGGLGAGLASSNGMGRDATVLHALAHAQSLHATAKNLHPAESRVYVKEIENACALLAYTDMEGSPLRGYLDQGRRIALAAQINSAILVHTGHSPHPLLEQVAKRTTQLWQTLTDHGHSTTPLWTTAVEGPEYDRLAAFCRSRRTFDLADFVADR